MLSFGQAVRHRIQECRKRWDKAARQQGREVFLLLAQAQGKVKIAT
jgi:hypothetical protein